ncbi:MAG: hypothetical protein IPK83_17430 [Planctomycetes bacterium]|nr:hypothetical protein [Planctomycetota bacterium]
MNCIAAVLVVSLLGQDSPPTSQPSVTTAESVTIQLRQPASGATNPGPKFTARFSPETLSALLEGRSLPMPVQLDGERAAMQAAIERINMSALFEEMAPI